MSSYHLYIHSAIVIHSLASEIVCAPTNLMFYRRNHMLFFSYVGVPDQLLLG